MMTRIEHTVPQRVVITGGAGFIGSSVSRVLRQAGFEVVILDRPDRLRRAGTDIAGCDCLPWDFRGEMWEDLPVENADVLIHLACTTLPATSMKSFSYDASSNIVGSLRVFEAAINKGVTKIIFGSSGGTVYGVPQSLPMTELHPTAPISAYGVSKLAIERYLALLGSTRQVKAISLRIGNPYGPLQYRGAGVGAIARYLMAVRDGEKIPVWGDGETVRDYLYIDDLTEAFRIALCTPEVESGEYNIGAGVGYSLNEVIAHIRQVTSRAAEAEFTSARSFDPPAIVLDSGKFQAYGWRPQFGLGDGIAAMWNALTQEEMQGCVV
jgi:UDP-glucose 4-epimerase